MKKILITGGTGFVGGRLARRLSAENEVYISSRNIPDKNKLLLCGNVESVNHQQLLTKENFPAVEAVIHLAALNEWDCIKYPSEAIRVNVDETRMILENSIFAGAEQFIYFSTAHVYGAPLTGSITEETLPRPLHPYAITHKAAEDYVVAASLQNKTNGIVFRLSNSFGAPVTADVNRWTLLANDLCRQAVEYGKLVLTSNGSQLRDFICLTDVEEVIARMVSGFHLLQKNVYNLGSGVSMRVLDMAHAVAAAGITVLRKNIPIELPAAPTATRKESLFFSNERLLSEGFVIPNDVNMELERLMVFCQENFVPVA